jgi:hypothetical protein
MEWIDALIKTKVKRKVAQVKGEKPKKPVAKSMMETTQAFSANLIAGSRTWIFAGLLLVFQLRPSWRKARYSLILIEHDPMLYEDAGRMQVAHRGCYVVMSS